MYLCKGIDEIELEQRELQITNDCIKQKYRKKTIQTLPLQYTADTNTQYNTYVKGRLRHD